MPCEPFKLPGGGGGFICSCGPRRQVPRCHFCSEPSVKLCDFPDNNHKSGTCDRPLCAKHAVSVGPDRDHCPDHPREQQPKLL